MKHYTVLHTQSNLTTALLKALLVDCADCVHSGFTHTHTHTVILMETRLLAGKSQMQNSSCLHGAPFTLNETPPAVSRNYL